MENAHKTHERSTPEQQQKRFEKYQKIIEDYSKDVYLVENPSFQSRAIRAGQEPDPHYGSITLPIHMTSTFVQPSPGVLTGGFDYGRAGNPTRDAFERCIAELEFGKFGLGFSSGCAAMTCILLLLESGDHIVCCDDVYGGTQRYIRHILEKRSKVEVTWVDVTNIEETKKAFKENTRMLWVESPTNPMLKICDIKALAEFAKSRNALTIVDTTFLSPYLQSPLLLGADISVNSCTKYIGGHTDLIMGSISTNCQMLRDRLFFNQKSFGGVPSPHDCFIALRGLKTLGLRMKEHCKNATIIANFLDKHPKIDKVIYPGLKSHPQHELAKQQQRGFGGMITFYIKGGADQARIFLESVKLFYLAESLGGVDSLIESPALMTHFSVPPEVRKILGIHDTLIRISVGIEDVEDLLADLDNALARI